MPTRIIAIDDMEQLIDCLNQGGVIAYPAEGLFGLGCHPDSPPALERIRQLKGRDAAQGFIVIGDCSERFSPWLADAHLKDPRLNTAASVPTTWLVPVAKACPRILCGDNSSLAVRIVEHKPTRELCRRFGQALVSTSANPAGQPAATTLSAVLDYFSGKIDAVLDAAVDTKLGSSRIVDLLNGQELRPYGQLKSDRAS